LGKPYIYYTRKKTKSLFSGEINTIKRIFFGMNSLNEEMILNRHEGDIMAVFKKIDIYNKKQSRLNEYRNAEVYFTINEQQAIKDVLRLMKQHLQEYEANALNEGWFDDMKAKGQKLVDKSKNAINKVVDKGKTMTGDVRKAIEFLNTLLKKGITKVSEFIKYMVEFFEKLGKTLKEGIKKLGGISNADDEKAFLKYVQFYVNQRKDKKDLNESLKALFEDDDLDDGVDASTDETESGSSESSEDKGDGILGKMLDKVKGNKALNFLVLGVDVNGKKLSIWKSILVSIVGSLVINLGIGGFLTFCGLPVATAGTIAYVILLIW